MPLIYIKISLIILNFILSELCKVDLYLQETQSVENLLRYNYYIYCLNNGRLSFNNYFETLSRIKPYS